MSTSPPPPLPAWPVVASNSGASDLAQASKLTLPSHGEEYIAPHPEHLRCVMIGDIVGKPGIQIAEAAAPWFRKRMNADVLIANAENAADGTGLRNSQFNQLRTAGYDVITLGDHVYKKREITTSLRSSNRLVRPLNFPLDSPGLGATTIMARDGTSFSVIALMGRVFMRPVDCPFQALDRLLTGDTNLSPIKIIDFHAEATSDKQTLARFADGRVSAIFGTHTHVATADEQILPGGTAYQSDIGMTGPFESILGRKIEPVLTATITFEPLAFHVATGDVRVTGCVVDIDKSTGHSVGIRRFQWTATQIAEWSSTNS